MNELSMPLAHAAVHFPSAPAGGEAPPSFEALLSLALYTGIAVLLIAVLLLLAWGLGRRTRTPVKGEPYESGVLPTGSARLREPVPFYLVAIFFIVFDVEAIFIVSWAVAWDLLGWAGFFQITFFIVVLFLGLVYLWQRGGLDWGPQGRFVAREAAVRSREGG
jgi:NADH-quinone oxidoreductase subunit A